MSDPSLHVLLRNEQSGFEAEWSSAAQRRWAGDALYDGLQVKQKFLVALPCYGGAAVIAVVAFYQLGRALERRS